MGARFTLKMTSKTGGLIYAYTWKYNSAATEKRLRLARAEADSKGLSGQARESFMQNIPRSYNWKSLGRWGLPGTMNKLSLEGIEDKEIDELVDQYELYARELEVYQLKTNQLKKEFPVTRFKEMLNQDMNIPTRYDKFIEKTYNERKKKRIEAIMEETGHDKDKATLIYFNEQVGL